MAKDKKSKEPKKSATAALVVDALTLMYRPKTLEGLIGQDHIATEIRGMLKRGRMPSTFLINGESGCGKTTTARMIARYVMCSKPDKDTFAPCGECSSCLYGDGHPDVHEINMAEQRGIDDVRTLIQNSRSMPTIGKFRIFIIDEAHAMTAAAAQAFLKPLEEPPKRTLWFLCTTNPEKLPTAILGRMHKFNIKRIEPSDMARQLMRISKREGLDMKADVKDYDKILKLMCDLSGGRMRDAIALLEKVLAAYADNKKLDTKTLMDTYLATAEADLERGSAELLASMLGSDLKMMLTVVRTVNNARGLLSKLRWLLQYLLDNAVGVAKYTPYNAKLFSSIASKNSIKPSLSHLVQLQWLLIEMETRFNMLNVDETVIMQSMLGNDIATRKAAK